MKRRTWCVLGIAFTTLLRTTHGQTCLITNPAQAFSIGSIVRTTNSVTLTWSPTCTNFAFGVFSTDQLTSNTQYQARAGMWGSLSGTSQYTDAGVTNRARFYKVLRIQPTGDSDWDGDGLSDAFELNHGLNPFSSGDATNDLDGDGYSNFDEALMNTDPTNPNDPITVYVDSANTNGVYDGTQAHPFQNIQDAIESSVDVSSNLAVRVRPGKYYEPVSNLQYDPYTGDRLSTRHFLYIYAANDDWSLSTEPETHVIDTLGFQHRDLLLFSNADSAPAVEFYDVARARINGFTLHGGHGPYGGAVLAYSSTNGPIYISNCIIEKNGGVNSYAGGIYIRAGTNSLIYNTVIAKNMGTISAVFDVNGSRIWNCTVISNQNLDVTLGAVTGNFGPPNVRNSIVWNGNIDLYFADVDYSTYGSNVFSTVGVHNLFSDPQLVTTGFGNYRLQATSPMIGAGTPLPLEPRDLYGNSRPTSGRFDIGANRFTDGDGDGVQDDWEIKHSLNPGSSGDATGNPDGDGFNNLAEYRHNTDPHNSDSDGDGIPDDQDPDPTTPDLVLDTIFWDYFFADTFLMYVDGVPGWINLPPTSPRPVVLNGYHIGSHVTFQWQVVDDPSFEAFLVFYVPHTTLGNIIPDLNATPLNQIQFGFGDWAPPGGPWGFTIALTTVTNTAGLCPGGGGFDDETPHFISGTLPALSVPQNGTNTLTVTINPTNVINQILFRMTNAVSASVSPSSAASATQVVSIAGSTTGNAIVTNEFRVLGYGAQNTFTTICSQVSIDILPKKTNVTVAIHRIIAATMSNTPPIHVPTTGELQSYLDGVFGKQANVYLKVLSLDSTNINYDTNHDGIVEISTNGLSGEIQIIKNALYVTNAMNVYYVNAIQPAPNHDRDGTSFPEVNMSFISDSTLGTNVYITAHELGHLFGLDHACPICPEQGFADRLMFPQDEFDSPCRLVRDEWEKVNGAVAQ